MTMFLVCGEALMDVFAAGDTPTGMTLDARVGGSPFNVAVGLARLGQPVSFLGALSTGFLGDRLLKALHVEGVGTTAVLRSHAPTALGLVGVDADGAPSYAFYADGTADRRLHSDALSAVPAGVKAIHLGSYACVVEPIANTLRELVEREQGKALIAYDPNVRLHVESDTGRWREMLQWMLPRTQLLKISDEDLGLLLPGTPAHEFAASALAQGVKWVVLTRGREGSIAWTPQGEASVVPEKVQVVDTVGAGDTFQAALLAWMAEHNCLTAGALANASMGDVQAALHFADRAAAITCSRRGADMPLRADLA
jgi:fructokinase